jgi:hypothetical protein
VSVLYTVSVFFIIITHSIRFTYSIYITNMCAHNICIHTVSFLLLCIHTQYLSYYYVYTQYPVNMYAHNILLICMHTISVYCVHSILCILVFRYTVFLPTRMYHSYLLCILVLVACIKQYPYSWVYSISFKCNA